jgi:hypothetical protein
MFFLVAGVGVTCLGIGASVLTTRSASAQTGVPAGCRSQALGVNVKDIPVIWGYGGATRMGATFKNQGPGPVTVTWVGTSTGTAMTLSPGREETLVFAAAHNVRVNAGPKQSTTVLVCNPF